MDKSKWEYKKLGEVCTFLSGLWIGKKPPYKEVGVIRNANFTKDCRLRTDNIAIIEVEEKQFNKKKLQKGDIIIEKSGGSDKQPVGRPVLFNLDGEYSFSNFTSALRIDEGVNLDPNFLHKCLVSYYFAGATKAMQSKTTGLHNLDLKMYKKQFIPIPSLSTQHQIVSELDQLSDIISLKQQQIKEYDALAQSLFSSMINIENKVEASYFIKSLNSGKSLANDAANENKVLKTGAVTYDYFNPNEVKNLPLDYTPNPKHLVKVGDVLISRMNTLEYVGACAYVWEVAPNTYLPDRLWRAELKDNVDGIYLWFSLIQDEAKKQIRSYSSGTSGSMKNISKPNFLKVRVPKAPLPLQHSFAEKVQAIEHQKSLLKRSIAETQTLLDSRMQEYFG